MDATAHSLVGRALSEMGKHTEAGKAHKTAIQLAPDSTFVLNGAGLHGLNTGDYATAEDYFRRSLQMEADKAHTLNNLGVALASQNHNMQAALAFKSAVALDPTLQVAKENTHNVMRGLLGGAGILGALGLFGIAKFGVKGLFFLPWLWRVFRYPAFWGVILSIVALVALVAVGVRLYRGWRLHRLDPQLTRLYRQLKADEKAGRL